MSDAGDCIHEVVYEGICVQCHKDVSREVKGSMMPVISNIKSKNDIVHVKEELAHKSAREDAKRLLQQRKLVLILDLDKTLIHTTTNRVVQNWIRNGCDDIHFFQIGGDPRFYYTKVRPGVRDFLEAVKDKYELHVYTMGTRAYAKEICKIIDPGAHYFSTRILTQDESARIDTKSINLNHLFPCGDDMVIILDDTAAMWDFRSNLIPAVPYDYFQMLEDVNVNVQQMAEAKATTAKLHAAHKRTKYSNHMQVPDMLVDELVGAGFDKASARALAYAFCMDAREHYEWQTANAVQEMQNTCASLGLSRRVSQMVQLWHRDAIGAAESARQRDKSPREPDREAHKLIEHELSCAIALVDTAFRGLRCAFRLQPVRGSGGGSGWRKGAEPLTPDDQTRADTPGASTGGSGGAARYKRRRPRNRAPLRPSPPHLQQRQHQAQQQQHQQQQHQQQPEEEGEQGDVTQTADTSSSSWAAARPQDDPPASKQPKVDEKQLQQPSSVEDASVAGQGESMAHAGMRSPPAPMDLAFELVLHALPLNQEQTHMQPVHAKWHWDKVQLYLMKQLACLAKIEATDDGGYHIRMGRWIANITRTLGAKGLEEVLLSRLRCVELPEACLILRMARMLTPVGPWKDMESDEAMLGALASKLKAEEGGVQRQPRLHPHEDTDAHLKTVTDICCEVHAAFYRKCDMDGTPPSTKVLLPRLHRKFPHYPPWVLEGVRIVFTGVIPRGQSAYTHSAWRTAVNLGAIVVDQLDKRVTHVVARVDGTEKVQRARKMRGIHIVHLRWLEACATQHRRVDEAMYLLRPSDSRQADAEEDEPKDFEEQARRVERRASRKKRTAFAREDDEDEEEGEGEEEGDEQQQPKLQKEDGEEEAATATEENEEEEEEKLGDVDYDEEPPAFPMDEEGKQEQWEQVEAAEDAGYDMMQDDDDGDDDVDDEGGW